jgi:phospholipid/cholesterol/gamma-HCH transport system substrate-binding protein
MRHGYQKVSEIFKKNVLEIILGAFVLFTAVSFLIFSFRHSSLNQNSSNFTIFAEFTSADGLKIGSDVRIAGVKVGSISEIKLNVNNFLAIASIELAENLNIPDDSEAIIITEGLIGQKYVSLNIGGSPLYFDNGDTLLYTQGSIDIINLLNKFSSKDD